MERILEIKKVENPQVLNPARSYGSSFSRATKVEINNLSIGSPKIVFVSGTASVDENGNSIHQGKLVEQAERMFTNIDGLLKIAGCSVDDIVDSTSATYVTIEEFGAAQSSIFGKPKFGKYQRLMNGDWYCANVCRDNLIIETDAVAARLAQGHEKALDQFLETYSLYHHHAMNPSELKPRSVELDLGGVKCLFLCDCAKKEEGKKPDTKKFIEEWGGLYGRLTVELEKRGISWKDVVNTRINLPDFLDKPPDVKDRTFQGSIPKKGLYYDFFNVVRTALFKKYGVDPFPSSTCIGIQDSHKNMLAGMSVLAMYEPK